MLGIQATTENNVVTVRAELQWGQWVDWVPSLYAMLQAEFRALGFNGASVLVPDLRGAIAC